MGGAKSPGDTRSSSQSNLAGGSSDVFIKLALEQLMNAKEAKKLNPLKEAAKVGLTSLENPDPDLACIQKILQPFYLACQSRQPALAVIAIDCLGKLFTYNYWSHHNVLDPSWEDGDSKSDAASSSEFDDGSTLGGSSAATPSSRRGGPSPVTMDPRVSNDEDRSSLDSAGEGGGGGGVIGQVVDTICDTFSGGENTDDKVQVQIVKALLAAVSSTDLSSAIHGGVLLRAIRTTYNIFLLSRSANTQIIAQATLTQMIQAVFGRVGKELASDVQSTAVAEGSSDTVTTPTADGVEIKVPSVTGTAEGQVDQHVKPDGVLRGVGSQDSFNSVTGESKAAESPKKKRDPVADQYIRDCYLVFRALCKLSMKAIPAPEAATELKSHSMRSKLLALHLVYTVLSSHIHIFFVPSQMLFPANTPAGQLFIHAVKTYICFTISRNAPSVVPQVFDITMDIFGKALVGLRTVLKKELSVVFTEIIIPIMEARSSITFNQRTSLLKALYRILSDPSADGGRLLVEIYLNYDCDIEATARENIWERLVNTLGRVMTQHHGTDPNANTSNPNASTLKGTALESIAANGSLPPAITTATLTSFTKEQVKELYSSTGDYAELKKRGLELLVKGILKPLIQWCKLKAGQVEGGDLSRKSGEEGTSSTSTEAKDDEPSLGLLVEGGDDKPDKRASKIIREDDPTAFESLKHRKQVLMEGIKRFNFKPKKGIQFLLDSACIPSRTPKDIALFLLHTEGLNKSMIGEFLGEGDEENIAIMHAFVDAMDFSQNPFVTALRNFLQTFRLPGESQKIDRFMLKFAERYLQGNPTTFSSADTAYVLAYSVIMLNTDQHNAQVKKRMTKADFLKNNRGIDEGKDLPPELLEAIFDEILTNEIVMKDEIPQKQAANSAGGSGTGADAERYRTNKKDVAQFAIASENMAMKTEALFNTILKSGSNSNSANASRMASGMATPSGSQLYNSGSGNVQFFSASHYEHVKAMFSLIWMSVLTGLSGPLQESEDNETIVIALEGFHYAARIACLFDMELERKAFVSTLSKFTQLSNLNDIRSKNLEAVKTLLTISNEMGNQLGESWKDVVVCVSQLEKLQVLGSEASQRMSVDSKAGNKKGPDAAKNARFPNEEVIIAASSQSMTIVVDRLFTSSVRLNGTAIVEFVRSLCNVSWDEITSSITTSSETPRMYCLQRLVEMSYYNMKRIRVEWSNIWAILGEHFNKVGCHPNPQVCFFALDKLRQLAMKFLELEELPNFKFQKDFLKPFEHVLANNPDPKIKDMVLSCLQQMIQAKGSKSMKSGWKAMFGAFIKAARETNEQILLLAFDIVKTIFKNHFESVVANLALPDFISCLVEFCKNRKFAKTSLQSVEILRQTIPRIFEMSKTAAGFKILQSSAAASEKTTTELLTSSGAAAVLKQVAANATLASPAVTTSSVQAAAETSLEDPNFKIWFPILFGLYEVVMTCDLEVRTKGLNYLFDALKDHGASFSRDSWEVVSKGVLFPIFDDLKLSRVEHSKFANREDMSVWLSTTLIQALRCFVDLFGVYFDAMRFCIDQLFELLTVCMTQENETLARIGSTCMQQFIESNISRIDDQTWDRICATFAHLFRVTTPDALFFDYRAQAPKPPPTVIAPPEHDEEPAKKESIEEKDLSPQQRTSMESNVSGITTLSTGVSGASNINVGGISPIQEIAINHQEPVVPDITGRPRPQKKDFQGIIAKCVLHLLVIQTLQEVLATETTVSSGSGAGQVMTVYKTLSSRHLLVLVDCLERSYRFASAFNADLDLRMALYKMGFMKQLPNLLKQETTSVSTYVQILIRMYADPDPERISMRPEVERRLIPLSFDILVHFNTLDPDSKRRNVTAWRPVVVAILNALVDLEDEQFKQHINTFYAPAVGLLLQDPAGAAAPEVRIALHSLLMRVGTVFGICKASDSAVTVGAPNPIIPPLKKEGEERALGEADETAGSEIC
ncbi:guanine nucleotide exchange protein for ADP-robosylation factor [Phlyctochytrium planicorne]|nr:guanine nucleotide exchange protein for ADP-robosylation factor [Phlyctochytrium planicorne]